MHRERCSPNYRDADPLRRLLDRCCGKRAVRLFHIPLYIIPPPSRDPGSSSAATSTRILYYTLVTGDGDDRAASPSPSLLGVPLSCSSPSRRCCGGPSIRWRSRWRWCPRSSSRRSSSPGSASASCPRSSSSSWSASFPILLNGILAFTSLSLELTRFCRSTGAGPLRTFFKVRLPAALPQLFVGIKGAAVNATVGATIAEWIGGDAGLGYYVQIASGDLRMDLPSPSSSCWPRSACCCSGSWCWRSAGSCPGMSRSGAGRAHRGSDRAAAKLRKREAVVAARGHLLADLAVARPCRRHRA